MKMPSIKYKIIVSIEYCNISAIIKQFLLLFWGSNPAPLIIAVAFSRHLFRRPTDLEAFLKRFVVVTMFRGFAQCCYIRPDSFAFLAISIVKFKTLSYLTRSGWKMFVQLVDKLFSAELSPFVSAGLVSLAAVFRDVRKDGCEGDYRRSGWLKCGRRRGPQALRAANPNNNYLRMTGGKKFDRLRSAPTWSESLRCVELKTWVFLFTFSAI